MLFLFYFLRKVSKKVFFLKLKMLIIIIFWVYGKARYSQIRRYSQIQNGLARSFKRTREGGFLYFFI